MAVTSGRYGTVRSGCVGTRLLTPDRRTDAPQPPCAPCVQLRHPDPGPLERLRVLCRTTPYTPPPPHRSGSVFQAEGTIHLPGPGLQPCTPRLCAWLPALPRVAAGCPDQP